MNLQLNFLSFCSNGNTRLTVMYGYSETAILLYIVAIAFSILIAADATIEIER